MLDWRSGPDILVVKMYRTDLVFGFSCSSASVEQRHPLEETFAILVVEAQLLPGKTEFDLTVKHHHVVSSTPVGAARTQAAVNQKKMSWWAPELAERFLPSCCSEADFQRDVADQSDQGFCISLWRAPHNLLETIKVQI